MKPQPIRRWDRETALMAWVAGCASVFSFIYYFRHGDILLYGDAVAHINIARRVFDSRTPGLLQLGTVWLPLPHLLMIPFLLSGTLWKIGAGGSIPSMVAYVLGTLGIFRLVRQALDWPRTGTSAAVAAWGAAVIYAANPNLIYLQTTAMTESLYLALFIWAAVYLGEFVQDTCSGERRDKTTSRLMKCGCCLAGACLTRYDGWFVAVAMCMAVLVIAMRRRPKDKQERSELYRNVRNFILLAASGPVFWLAYNAIVYRNPLEFANGPYSAKAIELRSSNPSHPGKHDLPVAFSYFLKSAEMNLGPENGQKLWVLFALAGTLVCVIGKAGSTGWLQTGRSEEPAGCRHYWPLLLLWVPLPFYVLSVAYGAIPIFMPVWWPFSYYNVRYGLELLPAFAVFSALAIYFAAKLARSRTIGIVVTMGALIFAIASYATVWRNPVSFREAFINSRSRIGLERELASFLRGLPPDSDLLMHLGSHVGAVQDAGIPLKRIINEGNHRTWKQPVDNEGLWERALADPARYADYVIAFEGDPVSTEVQKQGLFSLAVIHVSGQPKATVYQTRVSPGNQPR